MPLSALEHIWREIISTFTYLQAPFSLHLESGDDPALMHDLAHFHFGFTVPVADCKSAEEVVRAVDGSDADLGLVRLQYQGRSAPWWDMLDADNGPMIISRLPVIEDTAPAGAVPALVVSKPLNDRVQPEILVWAVSWTGNADPGRAGWPLLESCIAGDRSSGLIAAAAEDDEANLKQSISDSGCTLTGIRPVGGYAAPIAG
jgi:hypothetical protein